MTVAGCSYDVLRLRVRMGPAGGQRVEGERWLDPGRLVVWQQTTRVYGEDGRLARAVSTRAFAADRGYFAIFSCRTNMLLQARSIRSGDIW